MPSFVQPPQGITRKFFRAGETENFRNLRGIGGPNHRRRGKSVDLARSNLFRLGEDVRGADDFLEAREGGLRGMAHAGVAAEAEICGDADFSATFAERKNFAGIQSSGGIKRRAHARHQRQVVRRKHQRHQFIFFHADAVLAGKRAAHLDAVPHDFAARRDHSLKLRAIALVEKNQRMQVAVAGMKNVADLQIVFPGDFRDAAEGFRQARARDHAVLHVVHRRDAPESAERFFPAFPEQSALAVVARHAHFPRAMQLANFRDLGGLRFDRFGQPLHLDQQHRGAILRESGVDVILDGAQRESVEHLACRGRDGPHGDIEDGFGGIVDRVVDREKRFYCFGFAHQAHGDFRDQRERSFRADEQPVQGRSRTSPRSCRRCARFRRRAAPVRGQSRDSS